MFLNQNPEGGAGMMYFAMPALFVTVLPFMVNLVNKAAGPES